MGSLSYERKNFITAESIANTYFNNSITLKTYLNNHSEKFTPEQLDLIDKCFNNVSNPDFHEKYSWIIDKDSEYNKNKDIYSIVSVFLRSLEDEDHNYYKDETITFSKYINQLSPSEQKKYVTFKTLLWLFGALLLVIVPNVNLYAWWANITNWDTGWIDNDDWDDLWNLLSMQWNYKSHTSTYFPSNEENIEWKYLHTLDTLDDRKEEVINKLWKKVEWSISIREKNWNEKYFRNICSKVDQMFLEQILQWDYTEEQILSMVIWAYQETWELKKDMYKNNVASTTAKLQFGVETAIANFIYGNLPNAQQSINRVEINAQYTFWLPHWGQPVLWLGASYWSFQRWDKENPDQYWRRSITKWIWINGRAWYNLHIINSDWVWTTIQLFVLWWLLRVNESEWEWTLDHTFENLEWETLLNYWGGVEIQVPMSQAFSLILWFKGNISDERLWWFDPNNATAPVPNEFWNTMDAQITAWVRIAIPTNRKKQQKTIRDKLAEKAVHDEVLMNYVNLLNQNTPELDSIQIAEAQEQFSEIAKEFEELEAVKRIFDAYKSKEIAWAEKEEDRENVIKALKLGLEMMKEKKWEQARSAENTIILLLQAFWIDKSEELDK